MLELAAALRIYFWEQDGFFLPLSLGLPDGDTAVGQVLRSLNDKEFTSRELFSAVSRLCNEKLAWTGPADLGAEVVVEDADEEILLEALAGFLWAHRGNQDQEKGAQDEPAEE